MSKSAQWAVVPDIRPWRGDLRRDYTPYVLTGGMNAGCLNLANWAKRQLKERGIACYVELVESH